MNRDLDTKAEAPPRSHWNKTNRFILFTFPLGHLVNDWPGAALWLLAPAIAISMDLNSVEVGLLITIHAAVASLAYFPAGVVGDYIRDRGLLLTITFWWVAIGYFLAATAPDFWTLAILLGLAGLGDAAWHPIATGVMVEQMPGRRAQVLGIHALGGTLAEVVAPLTVGVLLGFFEWQTVLQISTIPAFIMGVVFLWCRRWVPVSRESSVTQHDLKAMLRVWLRPEGIKTTSIIILYNMSLMGGLAMLPLYIQSNHGLSMAETGVIFASVWVIGALAQPFLGHLSDIMGRKRIILSALTIASALLCAASMVNELIWIVALLLVAFGALVGVRAVLLAAMVDVSGKRETTTLGFAFAVMDGVGALGAFLAGVAGKNDLRYAFFFAAAVAFLAMTLTAIHRFRDTATE
ncbi:MAG: MFS transporter [Gammaproteobacteria bacterium]|nr:MFS transporter [Gammaproteobacteria bacterium]